MLRVAKRALLKLAFSKKPLICWQWKGNQKILQEDIQSAIEAHWGKKPEDKLSDIFAEQTNSEHGRKEYLSC